MNSKGSVDAGRAESGYRWAIPKRFSIASVMSSHQPDRLALIHVEGDSKAERYTFGQISQYSRSLAGALYGMGVHRGDRVAVVLPQSPEAAISHLAIYGLGAIAVPISPLFRGEGLAFRLRDSGTKMVITNGEGKRQLGGQKVRVLLADGEFWSEVKGASTRPPVEMLADGPAMIIYTSGTTGEPRGAVLPQRTLPGRLTGLQQAHFPFPREGNVFWTPADWSWVAGLLDSLLAPWSFGVTVVSQSRGRFDPAEAFRVIEEFGVTNACIPPTAFRIMLAHLGGKRRRFTRLWSVHGGGEVLTEKTFRAGEELLGIGYNEIYGLTEAGFVVGNSSINYPVRPGSMGRSYHGHEVEVVSGRGKPLPPGRLGEIAVRRDDPVLFLGYWNDPEGTESKFVGDWFLTGDLGMKDSDGYFWFKGRKGDLIKSAGYRISPVEIEVTLMRHQAVQEAAVTSVPDETRGAVIKAFVKLAPGWNGSEALGDELRELVRQNLALHEYPRVVEFVDELPKTVTGKLVRRLLRPRLVGGTVEESPSKGRREPPKKTGFS